MKPRCRVAHKVQFATEDAAARAAQAHCRQGTAAVLGLYLCPHCRTWHLTRSFHGTTRVVSAFTRLEGEDSLQLIATQEP